MIIWSPPGNGMMVFIAQLRQEHQVGHSRIRSLGGDLSLLSFLFICFSLGFGCLFSRIDVTPFGCLVDKMHTTPRISLVNIQALNYLLRLEIFVSEDGQLRAAHLILDYEPLSRAFVDVGQVIRARAGSPRLARIDVSKLGFLA